MPSSVDATREPRLPKGLDVTLPEPGKIGVEIRGLDAAALGAADAAAIRELVYRHKLVVFRDQRLDPKVYIAFAQKFGTPQIYFQHNYHHPDHPEIFVSANVPLDGKKVGVAGTGRYWHTDYQFFDEPLPTTMVYPQQLPNAKRETYYIDMERVLDRLPAHLRSAVDGARCVHEAKWRYKVQPCDIDKSITEILEEFGALTPPVIHPAILTHPVTGARSLYISEGFTVGIEGLRHEESKAALREIFAFTERPENVHTHPWRDGDILYWDNRTLLHRASSVPKGQPSVSFRIGVYDGLPFFAR
jgi:taurine dioxygenase